MCGVRALRRGGNVDELPVAALREGHGACDQGEHVVFAHAHADAGVKLGAALADEHVPGDNLFAAVVLDAQALGIGVATVAGGAGSLFGGEKLKVKTWNYSG